jgi:hypothetical protein
VFECIELGLRIEMKWNTKAKTERKWSPILILLFGRAWYLLLESKGGTQFQFLLGCTNRGIGYFVEFRQYKLMYNYEKQYVYSRMFTYYFSHIKALKIFKIRWQHTWHKIVTTTVTTWILTVSRKNSTKWKIIPTHYFRLARRLLK